MEGGEAPKPEKPDQRRNEISQDIEFSKVAEKNIIKHITRKGELNKELTESSDGKEKWQTKRWQTKDKGTFTVGYKDLSPSFIMYEDGTSKTLYLDLGENGPDGSVDRMIVNLTENDPKEKSKNNRQDAFSSMKGLEARAKFLSKTEKPQKSWGVVDIGKNKDGKYVISGIDFKNDISSRSTEGEKTEKYPGAVLEGVQEIQSNFTGIIERQEKELLGDESVIEKRKEEMMKKFREKMNIEPPEKK